MADTEAWLWEEAWLLDALGRVLKADETPDRTLLTADVGTTAGILVWKLLVDELGLDVVLVDAGDIDDELNVKLEVAGSLEVERRLF